MLVVVLLLLLAKDFKEVKLLQTAAGVPLQQRTAPLLQPCACLAVTSCTYVALAAPLPLPLPRSLSLALCVRASILFVRKHVGAGPMYRERDAPPPL